MNSLSRISVTSRLFLGFGLLATGLVVLAWNSDRAQMVAIRGLGSFQQAATHQDKVQELKSHVIELQRNVQLYSYLGQPAIAERVKTELINLKTSIDALGHAAISPEEIKLIDRLKQHVETYHRSFAFAVEERTLRDKLVKETVPDLDRRAQEIFAADGFAKADVERKIFMLMQLNLQRYLVDPEFAHLTEVTSALRKLQAQSSPAEVLRALNEYERTFTRIVQATRGYLFLVSVVLAGEAMEFSYTANELSKLSRERVTQIANNASETSQRTRRLYLTFSVLAVLFGIGLAAIIGRSISRPLSAIAGTLGRLGRGERGVEVPGIERSDEIGVMARAANVFREQNERTSSLLEETQRLASSLDQHKQDLERSNNELEQFVYTVSHDLKAPLVTSAGFLWMMRDMAQRGQTEAAFSKLEKIDRAHRRMNQLISDLLELSRVGRTDRERALLDLDALVGELITELKRRFPKARFEVEALGKIWANESRILQVFENLLGNAMKYSDEEVSIKIGSRREPDRALFFVEDDGPGIAPEFHEHIFGLFQRLDPKKEGTGIGLAIVRRVMTFHGGTAWIESQGDNSGARFWLEFPRQEEA